MSNIDQNSLVFALPNEKDPDAKVTMCQMPMDMIMNWMFVVHPHVAKYRAAQKYYITLSRAAGVDQEDVDAILNYSHDNGMRDNVQTLMMEVINDLRETMGDEDFLDLYQMETTDEDDAFLSSQNWVGLNPDGTSHIARLVDEVPEYNVEEPTASESDTTEQHD